MKKENPKITIPHRDKKPDFYCVKTTYHNNGKIESEVMADEESGLLIAIEDPDKPLDEVFEAATATIYYTYHEGYAEAARQVATMTGQIEQTIHMVQFAYLYRHFSVSENQTGGSCQTMFRGYRPRLLGALVQPSPPLAISANFVLRLSPAPRLLLGEPMTPRS